MRRSSIVLAVSALILSLVPAGAQAAGSAHRVVPRDETIPPPVATGELTIGGVPQDGQTVAAAGLSWHPGRLPTGMKLLSFQVADVWQACASRHAGCVPGADTTSTPFAAARYVVGHADTGAYLGVKETATEVVQTQAVPFTFKVVHASRRASFRFKTVLGYPAGLAPTTRFVNGTPERRTGSTSENFQVQPPHYAAADGVPTQQYQVDAGSWTPVPTSEVFPTGTLALGWHTVRVKVSNAAGSNTISFSWQVVPLPAPVSCTSWKGHECWFPPHLDGTGHPMRWDWQIGLTTPQQRTGPSAVDIYDVDGFLTTPSELQAIHTQWQAATLPHPRAICYLDLAWEDYRPDGGTFQYGGLFPGSALGNVYFGYPQERWVDFRRLGALTPMLDSRMAMCAAKGFDAIEFDDIQPSRNSGFNLTSGDIQNYLASTFNTAHRLGLTVLWKNNGTLSWWGRQYADGAIVEECYVYHECFSSWVAGSTHGSITCTKLSGPTPCGWDDFTSDVTPEQPTGKWVGEAEYKQDRVVCDPGQPCRPHRAFSTYCSIVYGRATGFAGVKFDVNLDGSLFYPCPSGT